MACLPFELLFIFFGRQTRQWFIGELISGEAPSGPPQRDPGGRARCRRGSGMAAVQIAPSRPRQRRRRTVYRYFPSKAELISELIADVSRAELTAIRRAADAAPGPSSALAAAVTTIAVHVVSNRRLAWGILAEPVDVDVTASRLASRREIASELQARIEAAVRAGHLPAQDTALAATALIGALHESLVGPLAPDGRDDAAKLRDAVQAITLFALRAVGVLDARARGLVVQAVVPVMPAGRGRRAGGIGAVRPSGARAKRGLAPPLDCSRAAGTCLYRENMRGSLAPRSGSAHDHQMPARSGRARSPRRDHRGAARDVPGRGRDLHRARDAALRDRRAEPIRSCRWWWCCRHHRAGGARAEILPDNGIKGCARLRHLACPAALPARRRRAAGPGQVKRVREIDFENRVAVVEPGVTNLAISQAVAHEGFYSRRPVVADRLLDRRQRRGRFRRRAQPEIRHDHQQRARVRDRADHARDPAHRRQGAGERRLRHHGASSTARGLLGVITEVTVRILQKRRPRRGDGSDSPRW